MTKMPKANMNQIIEAIHGTMLSQEDLRLWKLAANIVIKRNGEVRASKPKVSDSKPETGIAAYVWRQVVFSVSPKRQHQCIPCTDIFDLPAIDPCTGKWSSPIAHKMAKDLKPLENAIVNSIPKQQWHGVIRWGRALGQI